MIDDWTNTTPYPKIEYPVRTEGYEGAPTADGSFRYLGAKSRRHPALLAIQPPLQRGCRVAPSPCYRARLSDSVQAACALLKTTPHARGDPVLLLLAQSRLLN